MKTFSITLALAALSSLLSAQISDYLTVEGRDSTQLVVEALLDEEDLEGMQHWIPMLDLTTSSNGKTDGWRFRSSPSEERFALDYRNVGLSFTGFSFNAKAPYQVGFGADTPSSNYEFQVSQAKALRLRSGIGNAGMEISAGYSSSIINKDVDLRLGTDGQNHLFMDSFGNITIEGSLKTEDGLILDYPGGSWHIEIGPTSDCGGKFTGGPHLGISNTEYGTVASISAGDGCYCHVSDIRDKKDLVPLKDVTKKMMQLKPVRYQYKHQDSGATPTIGLLAQDLLEVFPDLVVYNRAEDRYSVKYRALSVLAIEMVNEQGRQISLYKEKLAQLEREILRLMGSD